LSNDLAIQAYPEGKVPFPDGAIIAALYYRHVPSEENNKFFGQAQSFVPGARTNIEFMVKDTKKYTATGGWGFAHFQDGKPGDEALLPSHNQVKTPQRYGAFGDCSNYATQPDEEDCSGAISFGK
jgi:hypothetical protein